PRLAHGGHSNERIQRRFRGQSGQAFLHCICPIMTQSGHRASLTDRHLNRYDTRVPRFGGGNETPRVHQFARRGGSVADRNARAAAGRADAACRGTRVICRGRPAKASPGRSARAGLAVIGLERRPQRTNLRWGAVDAANSRRYAAEIVALAPDVILTGASAATAAVQEATRTLPIVFVNVSDPVGAGYVASLARPGGNVTGFTFVEYGMSGKWLELLKEIAPRVTRVAILRDPTVAVGIGQLGAIQSVAPSFGVEASPIDVRNADEIERAITDFARTANGGLIVIASPAALIIVN